MKSKVAIVVTVVALLLIVYFYLGQPVIQDNRFGSTAIDPTLKVETQKEAKKESLKEKKHQAGSSLDDAPSVVTESSCNEFREKHPIQEEAFNAIIAEIFMSEEDTANTSVFTNMDMISIKALANGGDREALFFLGDGMSVKAIYGKDFYGPKAVRNSPSKEEIETHKVDLIKLTIGRDFLFRAGVRGKLGAFLSLQMNSDLATRQLIRTEPDSDGKIRRMMADLIAYNRLLSFVHKSDEPFRLMFAKNAKNYYDEHIQKHYKNWKPDFNSEEKSSEIKALNELANLKYQSLEQKWIEQREFYGFDVHPKLLSLELEEYLMNVSKLCWS